MSLTSSRAREPASVVSVCPTEIRPSPTRTLESMCGVPMITATCHEPLPTVASAEVGDAVVYHVTPTITAIAAAAASAGPRNLTPKYVVRRSAFAVRRSLLVAISGADVVDRHQIGRAS